MIWIPHIFLSGVAVGWLTMLYACKRNWVEGVEPTKETK